MNKKLPALWMINAVGKHRLDMFLFRRQGSDLSYFESLL
jgi:hypothetical protein